MPWKNNLHRSAKAICAQISGPVYPNCPKQIGVKLAMDQIQVEILRNYSNRVAPKVENLNQTLRDLKDLCPFLGIAG